MNWYDLVWFMVGWCSAIVAVSFGMSVSAKKKNDE